MKKNKIIWQLVPLVLLICALVMFPIAAKADFGSFSGDSDYGSSGGSSWDSDDDYDYGSGGVVFLDGDGPGGGFMAVVAALVFVFIVYAVLKKNKSGGQRPAGAQRTDRSSLLPMAAYPALDPAFDTADFQQKLSNLYVQMQNGWQDKNIESLRPYFTDAYFTQMERQVEMYKKAGRTNYVERIAVLGVDLLGYFQQNGEDHIIAEVRTRIVDYTLNDADGSLLSGSKTAEKFMTYEWELTRESGRTTGEKDGMTKVSCPSCGAPLSINTTAKCPYCDSVVTLDQHDWAINSIRGIAQETR